MGKVGFFKSIHFKFAIVYVLLILVAIQFISVYFNDKLEDQFQQNYMSSIRDRAELLADNVSDQVNSKSDEEENTITSLIRNFRQNEIRQILVVNSLGQVVGTLNDDGLEGTRATNDYVNSALNGVSKENILIDSEGERFFAYSYPIKGETNTTVGAVYIQANMNQVFEQADEVNSLLAQSALIALVLTGLLGIIISRTITRPISDMRRQALVMARGDFTRKVKVYGEDEIGQLALAFNDLTRRLQEANAITEGERRKLTSVLAYMTDGVIATDREGMIILMNDRAEEMMSVSRETVLGTSLNKILQFSEEKTWDDVYNGPDSMILDLSDDHQTFILRVNFSIIHKEDGPINGLIAVLHDITEQEQLEQERREFVVNVSHELRTPLTTMRSYLEALQEGALQDPEIAPRFLSVTQNETERMIRLVNDLLQLSKMDKKEYRLEFTEVDFVEMFDHVLDRFEMSKRDNINIVRQLPRVAIYTKVDQDKMTQVLDNILSNAIKYSPDGGTITARCWTIGKKIRISISDEGVGIPKNNLSKIFDRFYRVDKARSRQIGGTGLGLAIAKEMIHAHHGDIWAESKWGHGTTIYFTLPYKRIREVEDK
ncbi:cell wall metabolism sensor histidine kinase WalK [Bacillus sp. N1-1]|jgi:two-component system, OmpR family, sensor histidine kinase VicK|uniref:cell wall metabolism sensor histidine kinase WalK n=1 Tax=Bacillus sp. N1-1 TaxID=2682541 RepID=UPI0013182116|nr:cell wall metabolism sensor histidine kinase WalK [Bacillus sp. N1-1]QHA94030.1 cell wall metabolism sensor histidine kinase WalK [Bacillus sp. N1-1]